MPDLAPETAALRAALDAAQGRLATEQTRRIAAETRLRTETGSRFAAQEFAVDTSLSQAEEAATSIQNRITLLQEEGKFSEAAAAMRELSQNEARITQLRGQKEWLGQQKQQVTTQTDPLERYNESERQWISQNPRYLEDEGFARKVQAAATYAMEFEGKAKDTPEYWEAINRRVYPERYTDGSTGSAGAGDQDLGGDPPGAGATAGPSPNGPQIIHPDRTAAAMEIDPDQPAQPQIRAAGPGSMMRAAPPSRRSAEGARRNNNRTLTPTQQEADIAIALYDSIMPDEPDRSADAAIRWYAEKYSDPIHQTKRRRRWVYGGEAA